METNTTNSEITKDSAKEPESSPLHRRFSEASKNYWQKIKLNLKSEMVLLFILGFLVGVVVKTEASKRVTIGFNDYKASSYEQGFNFKEMEQNVEAQPNQ